MDSGDYFWMLVKAYNPNQYEKLLERPMRSFLVFLAIVTFFSLVVFTLFLIPTTYNYVSSLPARTAEMETFTLNAEVAADHQVTLLERPLIMLNLEENATRTGDVTLTNEGILYPKYLFFGTRSLLWNDIRNLKDQTAARDNFLGLLILFLLPSIIFWFFLYSMLKIALIFLLLILLGYSIPRIFKHSITMSEVTKIGILALPSIIVLGFGLYPLAPLFWWGLLLTATFFFIGIALISELQVEEKPHKR